MDTAPKPLTPEMLRERQIEQLRKKLGQLDAAEIGKVLSAGIETTSGAEFFQFAVNTKDPQHAGVITVQQIVEFGAEPDDGVDYHYENAGQLVIDISPQNAITFSLENKDLDTRVDMEAELKRYIEEKLNLSSNSDQ